MGFSWVDIKKRAIDKKIARAKIMSKSGQNKDFRDAHPDWIQAATSNNYTQLKSDITKIIERKQALAMTRRAKRAGK